MNEVQIINSLIFYCFAGLILLFSLLCIFSYKIMYSLLFAVVAFLTVAGVFFILGADYNAIVQIAIYGIAIPILFIFAIMFTDMKNEKFVKLTIPPRFFVAIFSLGLLMLSLIYLFITTLILNPSANQILVKQETFLINKYQMFASLSKGLYENYVIAFELMSVLLLIAIIGLSTFNIIKGKKRG